MARKSVILETAPPVQQQQTKFVDVLERHTYSKEVPLDEPAFSPAPENEEPAVPDVFATFNDLVSTDSDSRLRIWLLPRYDIDGRNAINGTERVFCGNISYTADTSIMLDQILARVPGGGTVQLELLCNGIIKKRGLLKLMQQPNSINPAYTPPPPPGVVIQAPGAPPSVSPGETVREYFGALKEMGEAMKSFMPEPTVAPAPALEPAPLKDRLLEGILVTAFQGDKVPADRFDKVLEVLAGGNKESSWVDTFLPAIAPHVGPFLSGISSGLNALLLRVATGAPVEAPPPAAGAAQLEAPPDGPPADPAEYAWRRVMMRILDDCWEHAAAAKIGALGIDVKSSAEAIVNLYERFQSNEAITGIIEQLINLPPEQVFDMCAMISTPPALQERILSMKQIGPAVVWLGELQIETKKILEEMEAPAHEDKGSDTE